MLSLIGRGLKEMFGFRQDDPVVRIRVCLADEDQITVTPAVSSDVLAALRGVLAEIPRRRLVVASVYELASRASRHHPVLIVDGKPVIGEPHPILDEFGPHMIELISLLVRVVGALPEREEFESEVRAASARSLQRIVAAGRADLLRPAARSLSGVSSCGRPAESTASAAARIYLDMPVPCDHPFTPFVEQAYAAAGMVVLKRIERGQMRRLRQDLGPILAALEAYPVDTLEADGRPTVAEEPVLAPAEDAPRSSGPQVLVIRF